MLILRNSGLKRSRTYSRLKSNKFFTSKILLKAATGEIVQQCNHRGIWDIPEVDPSNSASIPLTIELSNIERLNHRHETDEAELVTIVDDDENERRVVFEGEDVDVDIEDDINIIGIDDDE